MVDLLSCARVRKRAKRRSRLCKTITGGLSPIHGRVAACYAGEIVTCGRQAGNRFPCASADCRVIECIDLFGRMNHSNKKSPPAKSIVQPFRQQKPVGAPVIKTPVAPPVYRPQPTPKVLQLKKAQPTTATTAAVRKQPVAPPVYRPQPTPKVLQRKTAAPPPAYRPPATPKVLQKKTDRTAAPARVSPPRVLPANSGVIQPMIAILDDNLNDIHIWHQVFNMLKKHPEEDVEVLEHVKEIKPGDRLAIVGHGNEKKVGRWYSPNILANQLSKVKLPENLKRIELLACRSGVGDDNSFAAELSRQMMKKHPVVGYRGDNFTTGEGKNRAEALGSTVSDYFRNLLRQFAKEGKFPSNVNVMLTTATDPLTAIGLSNKTFEGMDDTEKALPLLLEALQKLMPEESKEQIVELENKSDLELGIFMKKFEETVNFVKSNKNTSLKPILIDTVKEYLQILGGESGIGTAREAMPQGRVRFERGTGEMSIKTHKEFQK